MSDQSREEISEFLANHSNEGTTHLYSAAFHFFIAKLVVHQVRGEKLTEAEYNQFAEEAWNAFVYPSILTFHTWVNEAEMIWEKEMVEVIVEAIKRDWVGWVDGYKVEHLADFFSD